MLLALTIESQAIGGDATFGNILCNEDLWSKFMIADKDNDGKVSKTEMTDFAKANSTTYDWKITPQEYEKQQEQFHCQWNMIDHNNDDMMEKEEFIRFKDFFCKEMFSAAKRGEPVKEPAINNLCWVRAPWSGIMQNVDTNNDGKLSWYESVQRLLASSRGSVKERLKDAKYFFRILDWNRSDFVEEDEYLTMQNTLCGKEDENMDDE